MNLTLSEIKQIYHDFEDCGATMIRLTFIGKEDKVKIDIRCTDDCEPYWTYGMKKECTLSRYTRILCWIANGYFVDDYGNPYRVVCEMEE